MKQCDAGKLHPLEFVTRMAVMAFVRAMCSRSGSAAKDWYDRVGKMLHWLERNVLDVGDFTWAREVMQLFTIGLVELHADGTVIQPETATYDNDDILEFARVWTGFDARAFRGACGKTSRDNGERVRLEQAVGHRRKHFGGANTLSDVDEVVFGRDLDGSNGAKRLAEHREFDGAFGRHDETRSPDRPHRSSLARTAGLGSQLSDVDEVVFGRDIDFSNDMVTLDKHAEFAGAGGKPSNNLEHNRLLSRYHDDVDGSASSHFASSTPGSSSGSSAAAVVGGATARGFATANTSIEKEIGGGARYASSIATSSSSRSSSSSSKSWGHRR